MSFPCFKTAAVSDNALKNKKNIHKTIIFKRKMQEKQKKIISSLEKITNWSYIS